MSARTVTRRERIKDLPEPATNLIDDRERALTDLDGIGKDIAEKIETLVVTGSLPLLEELQADIPASVLSILRVPGLGPKKAAVLFHELGVTSLESLQAACQAGRVQQLKGFGAKTEKTILAGIDLAARATERIYWADADQIVQQLRDWLADVPGVRQIEAAGSYRRGRETVGDLDFLVDADESEPIMDRLGDYRDVAEVLVRGGAKMSVRLGSGLQVDLRVAPPESFGAALQYFTGSKDHNVVVRSLARERGLKVNEWGVFRVDGEDETYLAGKTEEEVYAVLDLPCFPPELREARQEFEWAKAGKLPTLVELADIRGDLHMHTTATDGKASLAEMVAAARQRGLGYIAITDHSQRVAMARGLDPKRALAQWHEIDQLNQELEDFRILKGIECDILEKGGMDLPDDVLAQADWVVASVHYGQNQPRAQITERILGAIANEYVSIIAHPTGRLINRREPYAVDLEAVFQATRQYGKCLELNANPARLDLDDVACAAAASYDIPIVISTDAHSTAGLDVMRYGILQARRAGLSKDQVANTRTLAGFLELVGRG